MIPELHHLEVPVGIAMGGNLFDSDFATFWHNDGNMATAWFDVELGGSSIITHFMWSYYTVLMDSQAPIFIADLLESSDQASVETGS